MENITGDAASAKMTGLRNPVPESQFPNVITAPGTDISSQPFFWSSFNIAPRRQQRGGTAARRASCRCHSCGCPIAQPIHLVVLSQHVGPPPPGRIVGFR
jgi:hypothetical protein